MPQIWNLWYCDHRGDGKLTFLCWFEWLIGAGKGGGFVQGFEQACESICLCALHVEVNSPGWTRCSVVCILKTLAPVVAMASWKRTGIVPLYVSQMINSQIVAILITMRNILEVVANALVF
jgi:hypothetical protein